MTLGREYSKLHGLQFMTPPEINGHGDRVN